MYIIKFDRNVIIFCVLLGFMLTFCFGAEFFCERKDVDRVKETLVLANCNLSNYTEHGGFAEWKKDDVQIGKCFMQTLECLPYGNYKEYFIFGSCGPTCLTLGINRAMSSYYIGEYYIETGYNGHAVRELALNLSLFTLNIASVDSSTITTHISSSRFSSYSQETTYPQITGEVNIDPNDLENITSANTSQRNTFSMNINIVFIFIAFAFIMATCFCVIGHNIYENRKRKSVSVTTVSRCGNNQDGIGMSVLSSSVHSIPIIIQPQAEKHESDLYQALHHGPMLPPRTDSFSQQIPAEQCSAKTGASIDTSSVDGLGASVTNRDEVGDDENHDESLHSAQDIYYSVDEFGNEMITRTAVNNHYVMEEGVERDADLKANNLSYEYEGDSTQNNSLLLAGKQRSKQRDLSDDLEKHVSEDVYYVLEKPGGESEDRESSLPQLSSYSALDSQNAYRFSETALPYGIESTENDADDEIYAKPHRFRRPQISESIVPNISPLFSDMYSVTLGVEENEYNRLNRPSIEDITRIDELEELYADVGFLPVNE